MKKKTINKVMILVVAGIAVFLSALTVASMTMEKPKTASQVETVEVEKGNVAEELDATGTVESRNKKVFFSPVNATVKKLNFEAGDSVRKGQQLVTYDLEDLEKENQKALLNVKSGRLDLEDAVNQSEEALEKQSEAKANVQTLEGQVDEWQQYVYDLQAAIQQRTTDAQNQAAAQASASAQEAAEAAQKAYQQQLKEYQESEKKLRDIRDKALTAYNQAKNEYDMAMETWKKNASEPNQEALLEKEKARTQAELAYKAAQEAYGQLTPPDMEGLTGAAGSADLSGASADTSDLQRELDSASATLAELQSELASEKAVAEADPASLSKEAKEKMEVANNLTELEAKSVEELIEEGKKGIQAEFNGVISDCQVAQGAAVTQGMQLFTLESTEEVSVNISVSKYDYEVLKEGQKATIEMGDSTYEGTLVKINRVAIPNAEGTPMIGAEVRIDNPDENIFIGVEAKVTVHAEQAKGVPVVPVEAVNIGKSGSFCYVLRDGVIEKQEVQTGISSDTMVEIKSGLKAGDQVIPDIGSLEEGDAAQAAPRDENDSEGAA
ncbi:MAG TPA: efflux RND transporter periplasmic adaptor subunit [Candidatus Ruminococcus avistercoris]|nr:efflux RND transporter periplasmic adaptor subunit [Candidatus Ruminococcus avistercoris]